VQIGGIVQFYKTYGIFNNECATLGEPSLYWLLRISVPKTGGNIMSETFRSPGRLIDDEKKNLIEPSFGLNFRTDTLSSQYSNIY
jgi:hypothetical protein